METFPKGVAVLAWAQEYTAAHNFKASLLTDAPTITWDLASNQVASVSLGGNRILGNPTNMKNGGVYVLFVRQDNLGGRTLQFGGAFRWSTGNLTPTLTATANRTDILTFVSDGLRMYGSGSFNYTP
jgi:hypothetical protein